MNTDLIQLRVWIEEIRGNMVHIRFVSFLVIGAETDLDDDVPLKT